MLELMSAGDGSFLACAAASDGGAQAAANAMRRTGFITLELERQAMVPSRGQRDWPINSDNRMKFR